MIIHTNLKIKKFYPTIIIGLLIGIIKFNLKEKYNYGIHRTVSIKDIIDEIMPIIFTMMAVFSILFNTLDFFFFDDLYLIKFMYFISCIFLFIYLSTSSFFLFS